MSLKVSRILHAGYLFECDSSKIAFDPIFENPFSHNCFAFPKAEFDKEAIRHLKLDAVFISHYHDDHCSFESLALLDRSTPIYIFCIFDEMLSLLRELGFKDVHSLVLNIPVTIGSFSVIPRKALDSDVDSIFHIQAAGLNVLNVVDSWIDDDVLALLAQTSWDLVLWPFQTMRELEVISPSRALPWDGKLPEEWLYQLSILKPRILVPSSCQFVQESWSWYNHAMFPVTYVQFAEAFPDYEVVRLNPGVSVTLKVAGTFKVAGTLDWVIPVGDQNVEYQYLPDLKVPATLEIARRFPALTDSETRLVLDYCRVGLLEKFRSMDASLDEYFSAPRVWRLSVFDHLGVGTYFYYRVDGALISLASEQPFEWCTEIPAAKLYAGLIKGETLTSMYVRINDFVFSPDVEKQIAEADIVEDPLLRCLFNGAFGAYQKAQLLRLAKEGLKKT